MKNLLDFNEISDKIITCFFYDSTKNVLTCFFMNQFDIWIINLFNVIILKYYK